jgi:sensor histidine kinase YesM
MTVSSELHPRLLTRQYLIRVVVVNLIGATGAVALIAWFGLLSRLSDVGYAIATGLIYAYTMGTMCGIILPFVAVAVERRPAPIRYGTIGVGIVILTVIGCLIGTVITVLVGLNTAELARKIFPMNLRISLFIALAIGLVMFGYESMRARLRHAEEELRERQIRVERARKLAVEAQLSSLESRLHPHFLFNTLNSVSALIQEDPQRAEEMVGRLAALLRCSLDANLQSMVPLERELKIVRDYLEIEKTRFGDRLRYAIHAPSELLHWEVPLLAVQTLVENSVKHAIAPHREGGAIFVRTNAADDAIEVQVADTGPGFSLEGIPAQHGLDNLIARLNAIYSNGASVQTTTDERGRAAVCVRFPVRAA